LAILFPVLSVSTWHLALEFQRWRMRFFATNGDMMIELRIRDISSQRNELAKVNGDLAGFDAQCMEQLQEMGKHANNDIAKVWSILFLRDTTIQFFFVMLQVQKLFLLDFSFETVVQKHVILAEIRAKHEEKGDMVEAYRCRDYFD
jgi:hypothetical protein